MNTKLGISGLLLLAVAGLALLAPRGLAEPQPAGFGFEGQPEGLISHVVTQEGRPTSLILVSPSDRRVGVYHVDPLSGELSIKSVRDVTWDLQMTEFNTGAPTPKEVRDALPRH